MKILQTKPYMLKDKEDQSFQSLGASISVKVNSAQPCGVFNLFEVSCPPDVETPLHIYYTEDVALDVLEGTLAFFWGDEKVEMDRFINERACGAAGMAVRHHGEILGPLLESKKYISKGATRL